MIRSFDSKGFTLIELMIVITIIGILAAIGLSLFASIRTRAFNSAAKSDLRNTATNQAGLFTACQSFGISDGGDAGAGVKRDADGTVFYSAKTGGAGDLLTGPPATAGYMYALSVQVADDKNVTSAIVIDISNNVSLVTSTPAITTTYPRANDFTIISKHLNGNAYFGLDSDKGVVVRSRADKVVGVKLEKADCPSPKQGIDDFGTGVFGKTGTAWQSE